MYPQSVNTIFSEIMEIQTLNWDIIVCSIEG